MNIAGKWPGIITKILSIVLGGVTLGLEGYSFDQTEPSLAFFKPIPGYHWSEGLEVTFIAISAISTFGTFLILFLRFRNPSEKLRKFDIFFHIFGSLLLSIGLVCLFFAIFHVDLKICGNFLSEFLARDKCRAELKFWHKLIVSIIGVINSMVYIGIGLFAKAEMPNNIYTTYRL